MNRPTQGMLLGLVGAICLRFPLTGEHRLYVNDWMKWPLLLTGLVLVGFAFRLLWTSAGIGGRPGPASAWLLLAPSIAVFVVSPPALGAFAANRAPVGVAADKNYAQIEYSSLVVMTVSEFMGRAQWDDTLTGYRVAVTGFVTHGPEDTWFVTSLSMNCCAADTVSYQAQVVGAASPRPAENTWVTVTGTWQRPEGTELPRPGPATIDALEVAPAEKPDWPFE